MLRQRIITALLLGLPVLVILLCAPTEWILLVLAVALLLGAWEWSGFLRTSHLGVRLIYVLIIAILMYAWHTNSIAVHLETLLLIAIVWWIFALSWIVFFPETRLSWLTYIAGLLVLFPMWIALSTLELHHAHGPQFILCLLLLVISTDIGGYFVGKALGHNKLAPRVSPGKTWEGVAGGVLSSMIIAVIAAYWLDLKPVSFVLLSLVTVIFSVIGDLTESLFKRHAGLKDSSGILPGHGGVLDRIDSITAAAPVFVYGLLHLNVVTW